jgi:hypothetical protein
MDRERSTHKKAQIYTQLQPEITKGDSHLDIGCAHNNNSNGNNNNNNNKLQNIQHGK